MIVLAGAFLTFVGFLFAGLLALVFAVGLDRKLGKEKALLLFTGLLLLFTLWQCSPAPDQAEARGSARVRGRRAGRSARHRGRPGPAADARPPARRTQPLPQALGHASASADRAAAAALVPAAVRAAAHHPRSRARGASRPARRDDRRRSPATGRRSPRSRIRSSPTTRPCRTTCTTGSSRAARKNYVYILSIRKDGQTYEEDHPEFRDRLFELTDRVPGWEGMLVEYALVGERGDGGEEARADRRPQGADARRLDRPRGPARALVRPTLRREPLPRGPAGARPRAGIRRRPRTSPVSQAAARKMAEVGRTGKEQRDGWRRAVILLEVALEQARARAAPAKRAEILEELVEAYVALRAEQAVLRALAEYARTSPNRPEPWLWLGQLHERSLGIPEEALAYFEAALARSPRQRRRAAGQGRRADRARATTRRRSMRTVGPAPATPRRSAWRRPSCGWVACRRRPRRCRAALALEEPDGPRALLAHGAVLYVENDLEKAREAFLRAATASGPDALEFRAQACYDLGLVVLAPRSGSTPPSRPSRPAARRSATARLPRRYRRRDRVPGLRARTRLARRPATPRACGRRCRRRARRPRASRTTRCSPA